MSRRSVVSIAALSFLCIPQSNVIAQLVQRPYVVPRPNIVRRAIPIQVFRQHVGQQFGQPPVDFQPAVRSMPLRQVPAVIFESPPTGPIQTGPTGVVIGPGRRLVQPVTAAAQQAAAKQAQQAASQRAALQQVTAAQAEVATPQANPQMAPQRRPIVRFRNMALLRLPEGVADEFDLAPQNLEPQNLNTQIAVTQSPAPQSPAPQSPAVNSPGVQPPAQFVPQQPATLPSQVVSTPAVVIPSVQLPGTKQIAIEQPNQAETQDNSIDLPANVVANDASPNAATEAATSTNAGGVDVGVDSVSTETVAITSPANVEAWTKEDWSSEQEDLADKVLEAEKTQIAGADWADEDWAKDEWGDEDWVNEDWAKEEWAQDEQLVSDQPDSEDIASATIGTNDENWSTDSDSGFDESTTAVPAVSVDATVGVTGATTTSGSTIEETSVADIPSSDVATTDVPTDTVAASDGDGWGDEDWADEDWANEDWAQEDLSVAQGGEESVDQDWGDDDWADEDWADEESALATNDPQENTDTSDEDAIDNAEAVAAATDVPTDAEEVSAETVPTTTAKWRWGLALAPLMLVPFGWFWWKRQQKRAEFISASARPAKVQPTLITDAASVQRRKAAAQTSNTTKITPAATAKAKQDDLTRLRGITPPVSALLNALGIRTFQKLSEAKADELRAVISKGGLQGKVLDPSVWIQQAWFAARDDWASLSKWQTMNSHLFQGQTSEQPQTQQAAQDDLTRIQGIDSVLAKHLGSKGITSFAQVAKQKPTNLRVLLSDAGPDYANVDPRPWPGLAALAIRGDWEKLDQLNSALEQGLLDTTNSIFETLSQAVRTSSETQTMPFDELAAATNS